MLQLMELKGDKNESNSKNLEISFTLIFTDDDLMDQAWSLLETCLQSYIPYNGIETKGDVFTGENGITSNWLLFILNRFLKSLIRK